jgi:hypothetical protein
VWTYTHVTCVVAERKTGWVPVIVKCISEFFLGVNSCYEFVYEWMTANLFATVVFSKWSMCLNDIIALELRHWEWDKW